MSRIAILMYCNSFKKRLIVSLLKSQPHLKIREMLAVQSHDCFWHAGNWTVSSRPYARLLGEPGCLVSSGDAT
jgi:hypothetical protein